MLIGCFALFTCHSLRDDITTDALPRSFRHHQQNNQTSLDDTMNNVRSIPWDEVEQIPTIMLSVNLWLTDNRFQPRPDKPNSRSLHRLDQLYNLPTYTFALIFHNLR